ncbi:unnamed protein product [Prunus armeniaca]
MSYKRVACINWKSHWADIEILGQLPASIEIIDMTDCTSLERFSTLSKILEDGDIQHIWYMNLSNCHRLCDNIGLDAAKMTNILVNQVAINTRRDIGVFLPGSEVPESFSFRKDVGVLLPNKNDHLLDFPIEIPWTPGLENLVLCTVCEPTVSFSKPWFPVLSVLNLIDGARRYWGQDYSVSEGLTGAHTKPKGGDDGKSDDQLKPSIHRIINVSYRCDRGLFKSFGAHLSRISMPKDGKDGDDDENEGEDESDDDDDDVR